MYCNSDQKINNRFRKQHKKKEDPVFILTNDFWKAEAGKAGQNYSMMGFQLDHNASVSGPWGTGAQGNIVCKTVGLSKA